MKTLRTLLILAFVGLALPAFAQPFAQKDLTSSTCPGSGCLVVQVDGQGSIGIQVTNTFVETLQFEQSIDAINYVSVTMIPSTLGASVTSTTGVGLWTGPIAGARWIRVRCSAYTSGTASVSVVSAQAKVLGGSSGVIASGLFGDGSVAAPSVAFASEPGLGWYRMSASKIGLAGNSGKTLFYIDTDGSIGMSNPGVSSGNAVNYFQVDGSGFFRINGAINAAQRIVVYNGVTTAGWGVPAVYAAGRFTAQTAAKASVAAYTVGAADGSFEVSCNVLVTVATAHSFGCSVGYTDEGNTARTVFLDFATPSAYPSGAAAIVNANGAIPYDGTVRHIRAKASTTITIATSGTFTTVTYNVEGIIKQIA